MPDGNIRSHTSMKNVVRKLRKGIVRTKRVNFEIASLTVAVAGWCAEGNVERRGGRAMAKKKYGPKSQKEPKAAMHEFKEGKLKSGGKSKKKVTNPKQAIAIGLSKARKKGAKVPAKAKSKSH
jgi:hypothetical protein